MIIPDKVLLTEPEIKYLFACWMSPNWARDIPWASVLILAAQQKLMRLLDETCTDHKHFLPHYRHYCCDCMTEIRQIIEGEG